MSCKSLAIILTVTTLSAPLFALTADDYLASGRDALFSGTVSGVQQAHATFEKALNDASCPDCVNNRELLFFHALSRIAMWVCRQDGAPVDSLFELSEQVDAPVTGDVIGDLIIAEPDIAEDRYGRPILPRDADEMLGDLLTFMEASGLAELDATIAELDRITETPADRFRVFLTPMETSVFFEPDQPLSTEDIEVDFAEVMMLKGMLHMIRGFITAKSAWDTTVSDPEALYIRHHENCLSFRDDILLPNPEFLKLLPTASDPSDGAAILLQARQDIQTALQYYLDLIAYVRNEDVPAGTDPQDDELLAIDPEDSDVADGVTEQIQALMDSLANDTTYAIPGATVTDFRFETPDGKGVAFSVEWGPFGEIETEWFHWWNQEQNYAFDDIDITVVDDRIYCQSQKLISGLGYVFIDFSGMITADHSTISNPFFQYYGDSSDIYDNLLQQSSHLSTEDPYTVDANPILGGMARYPQPVSPRGLLCELDKWNMPVAGTLPDATLGGILPEATDQDWTRWFDPQPAGNIDWPMIESWQMHNPTFADTWPAFWLDEQCVFADAEGEPGEGDEAFDIRKLYLGLDWRMLYGNVTMAADFSADETTLLQIFLSHSPEDDAAPGSLMLEITIGGEGAYGRILYLADDSGTWWTDQGTFDVFPFADQVDFRVPLSLIPTSLAGRFLTVNSGRRDPYFWVYDPVDENSTHLQLGATGTVSGTVTFPGWLGGPIIVQAFSEFDEPEDSLLASTVLDAPGAYTLEGIGLGWNGYIRAISPLFGQYHLLDMDAIKAESVVPVSMQAETVSGVDLNLGVPMLLPHEFGYTHTDSLNTTTNRRDVYAFDAIAGVYYYLRLDAEFNARLTLMDRNGSDSLVEPYPWEGSEIYWQCPLNGRYYVEVAEYSWWRYGGTYDLTFSTGWYCPDADISSAQWSGVRDCRVDLADFALLAGQWLSDCGDPYWCQDSDYDTSGSVDLVDFLTLTAEWLEEGGMTI